MTRWCWKCGRYSSNNRIGLCYECTPSFAFLGIFAVFILTSALVYVYRATIAGASGTVLENIVDSVFEASIGLMVVSVLGLVSYMVIWKWLIGWIVAIVRGVKSAIDEVIAKRQRNLLNEAIERAKLANPQHLNGQQLDALLTEQHKEKMGWK